jgi:hypothetical protein
MNRMTSRWALVIFINLVIISGAFGQLTEYPISPDAQESSANFRTSEIILTLPFWEDFYNSNDTPSDSLWQNSNDVLINDYYAYLPPTAGVATFDGLKYNGSPYSTDPESSELTDRLTSGFIDLSAHSPSDNIYLSFFYQFGGYGEAPDVDDGDRLMLEFKNESGAWQQAIVITPGESQNPLRFYQVLVPVNDPVFFHDNFQFALQSFGNQSGPFDVWNVDYIYINTNRSSTDLFYPDRAIIKRISNIFKDYVSIPRTHVDFESDYETPYYLLGNLYDLFQTYRQEVSITVFQEDNTTTVHYPQTQQGTNSPIFPDEIDTVKVPFRITSSGFPPVDSNIYRIDYKIAVNTFDNRLDSGNYNVRYEPIDFRVNDTIRQSFFLEDYYAYDDGTAEAAAGLQVAGNQLAYRFGLKNVDSTYIYAIDINTVYSGESALGKSIDLHVWSSNNGKPADAVYTETVTLTGDNSRSSFSRYELARPPLVKDTFYIGFTLNSTGRAPIGLDKSSHNSDKLLENIDGNWFPVGDRIIGSLMIRPVVGPEPDDTVTGVEKDAKDVKEDNLQVYPNPSADGIIFIKGKVSSVNVFDISGKEASFNSTITGDQAELYIPQRGVFILHIVSEGKAIYRKVIVE